MRKMHLHRQEYLGSYFVLPSVHFGTQKHREQVLLMLRAHPITQIPWVFNTIILIVILIAGNIFIPTVLNFSLDISLIVFINIAAISFIFSFFWVSYLTWYFNVGILTQERIIDVDYSQIVSKSVAQTETANIQDVTAKTSGYFGTVFNYGNVFVQTSGHKINIEFLSIPKPNEAAHIINQLASA